MPLVVLRPEPGWTITAETARAMGMDVAGIPLFTIEPVDWDPPEAGEFDGLLVGSANVFRHAGGALKAYAKLPVHVVGDATADVARSAGMVVGQTGRGGLQDLLDELSGRDLRLLRLAGEERVPLRLPAGITAETCVVYRASPNPLDGHTSTALAKGAVVALHSGAAARRFADEVDRLAIDRAAIQLVAISERTVIEAGEGWQTVHIADVPEDSAILAKARALCQTS